MKWIFNPGLKYMKVFLHTCDSFYFISSQKIECVDDWISQEPHVLLSYLTTVWRSLSCIKTWLSWMLLWLYLVHENIMHRFAQCTVIWNMNPNSAIHIFPQSRSYQIIFDIYPSLLSTIRNIHQRKLFFPQLTRIFIWCILNFCG